MKKGIIFTMDAVFALLIVAASVPLIVTMSSRPQPYSQSISLQADSAIESFSELSIRNVRREPVIYDLYNQGLLTDSDLDKSVTEVLLTFWASNSTANFTIAQNITSHLLSALLPDNVDYSVSIENETIFDSGTVEKGVAVGRRVSSGYMKGEKSSGYIASVFLTSIASKMASSYYFFGGFVGEGNVTATIRNIPYDANMSQIYLELNSGDNFALLINNNFCMAMNVTVGNFTVNNFTIANQTCLNYIAKSADNNFTIAFTGLNMSNEYVGGGYLKITYSTAQLLENDGGMFYYRFPGINGLINLYDSFYVPGNITSMNANITFFTGANYSTMLYLGNVSVMNNTGTGQKTTVKINDSTFLQLFSSKNISYASLSQATIPLRMVVVANLTGGNLSGFTDVILITDLSGSMAWRLDQDNQNGNTINDCSNPAIYSPATSRISLAKCLDKSFINAVLGGPNSTCSASGSSNNRVGLVGFSTDANNWESLTNNVSYLESRINLYSANSGTCIACAINRAGEILAGQSSVNRTKYIIVMTDGVANYRPTPACFDMNDVSGTMAVGDSGAAITRTPPWISTNLGGSTDNFNAVSAFNSTLVKAVAPAGNIYNWNGQTWMLEQDIGNYNLYGVDVFNSTLGFAVGSSAKIWKWNGATWSQDYDAGNFNFRSVAFLNKTFAFAVGDSGAIYSWNGAAWSLYQDLGSADLYSVDVITNFGVIGGTSGKIYTWNGATWTESTDTGSNTHYDVSVLNSTKAFTASSNGRVYTWNGTAWSNTVLSSYSLGGIYVLNTTLAYAVGDGRGDVYEWNGASWQRSYSSFYYQGNATGGISCNDDDSCSLTIGASYPSLNANYSAYSIMKNITNATIDSVGFGPIGTCTLGNQTVREMAKTGNGTAYASSNASQLQNIYCQIAQNIVTLTTQTQQITPQGELIASQLFPESFIEFNYTQPLTPPYQEITIQAETQRFPGCDGTFFPVPQINITSAVKTSYSEFYWTKTLFLNNSRGYRNIYNLSLYGKKYESLGDPFKVSISPALLVYNETNVLRSELGLNASQTSTNCSSSDKIIYTGLIRASVPYGNVFSEMRGGVARVYYDIDHDGAGDGYDDVRYGSDLPNFDPTPRTMDQLNGTDNALNDALVRLMDVLNYVVLPGNSGVSGSQTNPIDIRLSGVNIAATGSGGIPFAWGPLDIKIGVKI